MIGATLGFLICGILYNFEQVESLWMLWGGLIGLGSELLIRLLGAEDFFVAVGACFDIIDIFNCFSGD